MASTVDQNVPTRSIAGDIGALLDGPEIGGFVDGLEQARRTGRKGYGSRALVGAALTRGMFNLQTWTETARLIREHRDLRDALGGAPSKDALYRFSAKLLRDDNPLLACIDRLLASLHAYFEEMGRAVAIDASHIDAWAVGHATLWKDGPLRTHYSDRDASWGHRSATGSRAGGSGYGYHAHFLVCTATNYPLACTVETASANESNFVIPLLDQARARGFAPSTLTADKGYDIERVHQECEDRGVHPVMHLRRDEAVKRGDHLPPACIHGTWKFHGADFPRRRTKWRCPTNECRPATMWRKASRLSPMIPHSSRRRRAYILSGRNAIESEFSLLKGHFGLRRPPVRGRDRMKLWVDLVVLARLASALADARAGPMSA